MKYQFGAFVSVLALTCCVHDDLASGLPRLEGQPVAQTLASLGQPTEKKQVSGETIYTWVNNQSGSFDIPEMAPTPVVIQNGGRPVVAFTEPHAPPVPNTYNWHCRLDITAKKGIITHTSYEGNAGGCQIFSKKLQPLITEDRK